MEQNIFNYLVFVSTRCIQQIIIHSDKIKSCDSTGMLQESIKYQQT